MSEKAKLMIEKLRATSVDKGGDIEAVSFFIRLFFIFVIFLLLYIYRDFEAKMKHANLGCVSTLRGIIIFDLPYNWMDTKRRVTSYAISAYIFSPIFTNMFEYIWPITDTPIA